MKYNTVELVGHYGGDDTHALSAWTSTERDLTEERKLRRPKLLKFLAENKHHTPFEKSLLHFLVTCDTASHIQILKHRVGVSVNGESARYKELKETKGYIPIDWPLDLQLKLSGHYTESVKLYQEAMNTLQATHGRKRAKESARFFLPYANQVTLDVSFNWRSFAHFLGLRYKPDAQSEICDIADDMLHLVKQIPGEPFKETIAAFGYNR